MGSPVAASSSRLPGRPGERENLNDDTWLVSAGYSEDSAAPFDDIVRVWTEDDILFPLAQSGDRKTKRALTLERMQRLADIILGVVAGDITDPDGAGWRTRRRAIPRCTEDWSDGMHDAAGVQWFSNVPAATLVPPDDPCYFPYAEYGLERMQALDAWGNDIRYAPRRAATDDWTDDEETGLHNGGPIAADDIVFALYSAGPDTNPSATASADNLVLRYTKAQIIGRLLAAGLVVDDAAPPP